MKLSKKILFYFSPKSSGRGFEFNGFTLIELLISLGIIGVIASGVLVSVIQSREKARDARRLADVAQINNAVELYKNDFGFPPGQDGTEYTNGVPNWIPGLTPKYMSALPSDPIDQDPYQYHYIRQSGEYELAGKLEKTSNSAACNDGGNGGCTYYEVGTNVKLFNPSQSGWSNASSTPINPPPPPPSVSVTSSTSPTGVCMLRDAFTSLPLFSAPNFGQGYAKIAIDGINSITGLQGACTQNIYDQLKQGYCVQNSNTFHQEVTTYKSDGTWMSTGCGALTCNFLSCGTTSPPPSPSPTPTPTPPPPPPPTSTTTPPASPPPPPPAPPPTSTTTPPASPPPPAPSPSPTPLPSPPPSSGTTLQYLWSSRNGGSAQIGKKVAVDSNDNIIAISQYSFAIVKFDPTGKALWGKDIFTTLNPNTSATPYGIAVDAAGNIFVTGAFQGTVDFGGGPTTSTVAGGEDIFVVKYSGIDGSFLWLHKGTSACNKHSYDIALDSAGNAYIVGDFLCNVDLGGGPLLNAGNQDIFIAKYSGTNGDHLWSKSFGGTNNDYTYSIAVDSTGRVLITGYFGGLINFGGGPITGTIVNAYLAILSGTDGSHIYSKAYTTSNNSIGFDVKTDSQNNIYLAGNFGLATGATVNFGGGALTTTGSSYDIYIAKLKNDGSHVWSKKWGGSSWDQVNRIAIDKSGDVALAGYFGQETDANFGGGVLQTFGGSDVLIAKYSGTDGSHLWSKSFGNTITDEALGVAVDSANNVIFTGRFNYSIDFGGLPLFARTNDSGFLLQTPFVVKFSQQ